MDPHANEYRNCNAHSHTVSDPHRYPHGYANLKPYPLEYDSPHSHAYGHDYPDTDQDTNRYTDPECNAFGHFHANAHGCTDLYSIVHSVEERNAYADRDALGLAKPNPLVFTDPDRYGIGDPIGTGFCHGDSVACPVPVADNDADTDRYSHRDKYVDVVADRQPYSYAVSFANGNCHPACLTDAFPNRYPLPFANANCNPVALANVFPDRYALAAVHPVADHHANAQRNTHVVGNALANGLPHPDTNPYAYGIAHVEPYCHGERHRHVDSLANPNSHGNLDTDAYSHEVSDTQCHTNASDHWAASYVFRHRDKLGRLRVLLRRPLPAHTDTDPHV